MDTSLPDLGDEHGFTVVRHDEVESTQGLMRSRLAEHAEPTSLVGLALRARRQTAGRGRRGGTWSSPAGGSYQTIALPPWTLSASAGGGGAGLLPIALGIGVAAALTQAGATVLLKWPNDLVLGGRKLGGLLTEVVGGVPLVGVGLNVSNEPPQGAAALTGWDADAVGDLVLVGIRHALDTLVGDAAAIVERFAAHDWLRGRSVRFAGAAEPGVGAGIDDQGRLLLDTAGGGRLTFAAGHVVSVDGVAWGPVTVP